jgi:hypothetical protein
MIYLGGSIGSSGVFITMEQQMRRGGGGIKKRSRPAFMEPLPSFISSSALFQDDAGYIGYLTDDESGGGEVMNIVERRRRELVGSDVSFSACMLMMIIVACGLLMLWRGFRPPTAGTTFDEPMGASPRR